MIAEEVKPTKITNWKNEPSLDDLQADYSLAKPSHDDQMSKIYAWRDLLYVTGPERKVFKKGRSNVQPKLVRKQAEWRYSALTEPFLSAKKLFSVSPKTFEDDAAAKQNELLLNWQFDTKVNKVNFIDNYIRAVVNEGTSIVKLAWERETKIVQEEVPTFAPTPIVNEQQIQVLQQAMELQQADPRTFNEQVDPIIKQAILFTQQYGQPVWAAVTGKQLVEREEIVENKPVLEVCNPQNIYIDPSCNGDFSKALFVIQAFETNKANLQRDGRYINLDKIDWESVSITEYPDYETKTPTDFNYKDATRRKGVVYEYWGYYDINGDGTLKPIVAAWIGNTLIRLEENPFPDEKIPYVLVPYSPVVRETYGEPDAEFLGDNQRILGAVTRGMIDSLARSANAQQGFAKGMLDPLNKRKFENGDDYEFNPTINPGNGGYIEHKYPDLPQSALTMLQMQNEEAESLTGVRAFSGASGTDKTSYTNNAAVRSILDAASKREMAILRRLAKGMVEIGQKIIAMNAVFLTEEEVIRVTNRQFITIKREDLKGNFDLEVDISTAEEDNAKAENLGFMLQTLGNNMDQGITLMILSEIADLKRMPTLAEKIRSWKPDPQQQQQAQMMQQMQMQLMQAQIAKLMGDAQESQSKAQENAIKGQAQAVVVQNKLPAEIEQIKANTAYLNTLAGKTAQEASAKAVDTQQTLDGTKHLRELEKQQAQSDGNRSLEIMKALGKPSKIGESKPDIDSMVGYQTIANRLNNNNLEGLNPSTNLNLSE